ncbi:DUF4870 domain-containing protein [Brachybacterium subflavum]|uniref:DUF4870 domain-containing protein n=1 Tax=Brachybacterium subflavum TaxID=2585206 RepID=UPI001266457E|nr:DUF4870 domain-containing protein [Brachybacterium subflavum]
MSENTGPVDPYGPRPDDRNPWSVGEGGSSAVPQDPEATQDGSVPQPDGTQTAAEQASVDQAPADAAGSSAADTGSAPIENEFSAPRPADDAHASPYGQASPYENPAPYGQGSPATQAGGQQFGPGQADTSAQAGAQAQSSPYGATQQGGDQQQGAGYQQQGAYQQQAGGYQQQGGYQQAPGAAPAGDWSNTPPPHIKGVSTAPMTGQPTSESDTKLWAIFAQLASILGNFVGAGFLGWLGPLIIFLVYKDRNRFIRYNAAEALNAAIAVVIAEIVLWIVVGIFTVITLGIGGIIVPIVFIPALLHIIFAIIGAVKANDRTWWNYPLNIRFVK